MGITTACFDRHNRDYSQKLSETKKPFRSRWPAHLFHHTTLANAASILRSGSLEARADREGKFENVAALDVLGTKTDAHGFVRLYFRPRTPTQFHIEGISRRSDRVKFPDAHAPTLVMLVFDAKSILCIEDTRFSAGNMQQSGTAICNGDQSFTNIPFAKVYHDSGIDEDYSIIHHRCAEVLAKSPMNLISLRSIYCRSAPERDMLIHLLGSDAADWEKRIKISDDLRVFTKRYPFLQELRLSPKGLVFRINPRDDRALLNVEISLTNKSGQQIINFAHDSLRASPQGAPNWMIKSELEAGEYEASVRIDGEIAFRAPLHLVGEPF